MRRPEDGLDGRDGRSAYQLARKHGFAGTEADWLASLRGQDGQPGKPGNDGSPGEPGKPGADGERGPQGERGLKGDAGLAGARGPRGTIGAKGSNGTDGWSPLLAFEEDGPRRVTKIVGWIGGTGQPPPSGFYVGPDGPTEQIGEATDLRGPKG